MPTGVFLWKPSCQQQMWKELHFFSIAKSCESNLRKNTKNMIYWISIYTSLMASKDTYNNKFLEDVCLGFGNTETFQIPTFWSMATFQVMKLTSESHPLKPKSLFHQATSRTVPSKSAETTLVHMFCVEFLSKQCQHYKKKQQRWRQHRFIRKNEYDPIPSNWMFTCWQLKTKYL